MIKQTAIERWGFRCPHCGTRWARDYEARHVTDASGQTWDYYSFNGNPAMAPSGRGAVHCRSCGASAAARMITSRPETGDQAAPLDGQPHPAELAHELAHAVEALVGAARNPGGAGFSGLGELEEVLAGVQDGLGQLPLLLHELGLTLEHARDDLSVHGAHAGDPAAAVRALYRAANTASDMSEPVVGELNTVRRILGTLEGSLAKTS